MPNPGRIPQPGDLMVVEHNCYRSDPDTITGRHTKAVPIDAVIPGVADGRCVRLRGVRCDGTALELIYDPSTGHDADGDVIPVIAAADIATSDQVATDRAAARRAVATHV